MPFIIAKNHSAAYLGLSLVFVFPHPSMFLLSLSLFPYPFCLFHPRLYPLFYIRNDLLHSVPHGVQLGVGIERLVTLEQDL